MADGRIEERIEELERRVGALERQREGVIGRREEPVVPPPLPAARPETARNPSAFGSPTAEHDTRRLSPAPVDAPVSEPLPAPPVVPPAPSSSPPPPPRPVGPPPPPPAARPAGRDGEAVERLIGGRWFAAIGALIVIAGLGLSLNLVWDQLPHTARVLGIAGVGAVLIALGEGALRRYGRAASAGPFGAGVGALFVAAFGAHAFYELIPVGAAFVLMAAVCAMGILIALRANLVSIGVLAVVGGYLTPLIARAPEASAWALPIYLLGLTGVGVGLGVWRQRYDAVRIVCWVGTTLVGTLWVFGPGVDAPLIALGFVGAVWGGYQLDSARRVRPRGEGSQDARTRLTPAVSRMLLGAVAVTGWASMLGWWLTRGSGVELWMVPAALGAACAMGAAAFASGLRVVRDLPRTDAERYGVVLTALAGSELFAALALGLSGWIETTTWLVTGTLIVLGGRKCRAGALVWYGLALLGFGVARAVFWEPTFGGMHATGQGWLGLVLTGWTGLLAFAAAALTVSARGVFRARGAWRAAAHTMAAVAVCLLAIGIVHREAEPRSVYFAWVALGAALAWIGRLERTLAFEKMAPVVVLGAAGAWALAELVPGWSGSTAGPGLHPGLWGAALIAFVSVVVTRLAGLPRTKEWEAARAAPWVGGLAMVFAATSFEVARGAELVLADAGARAGAVSVWWGLVSVGLIVAGRLRELAPVRWAGLGLMLVAAGKAVVVDLAGATPGVRVASFLALGVLMMLVAAGYLRVTRGRLASNL